MTNPECCATSAPCSKWMTTRCETASTGEEALQQVEKGLRPDLVLLDLLMPGIDGLQTLEQLRQLVPGHESRDAFLRQRYPQGGAGHPPGRARLSDQAFSEGGAGHGHRSVPGKEPAELCRRSRRAVRRRIFRGRQPGDAQDSLAGCAGRQRRYSCPDAGRERHRQGSGGAADSQAVAARPSHFSESELRGRSRRLAGKRVVRLRGRSIHRRQPCQAGQIRALQQGHDPARRNRRNACRCCRPSCCTYCRTSSSRAWAAAR